MLYLEQLSFLVLLYYLIYQFLQILEGIKKYYEEYHKVKISSDVIRQAVIMSEKYIHDRFLPDKAIDILDEACSRINLENKELYKLEMLKQELSQVQAEKEEVVAADSTEDYQRAANNGSNGVKIPPTISINFRNQLVSS